VYLGKCERVFAGFIEATLGAASLASARHITGAQLGVNLWAELMRLLASQSASFTMVT